MRQSFDHQPRHCQIDQGLTGGLELFVVFTQPPVQQQPGEGAFDDPPAWQHMEPAGDRRRLLARSHLDPADARPPMLHDLQRAAQRDLNPLPHFAAVGAIGPDILQAGELPLQGCQEQLGAIAIGNIGRVHDGTNAQALRIDQQMALATVDFLPTIIAPGTTHDGRFNRLAIDDRRTRLWGMAGLYPGADPERHMQPLPQAPQASKPEVMVDRFPGRQVVGQQTPSTTAPLHIENAIEDVPDRMAPRPPATFGEWQMGLQIAPFSISDISGIRLSLHSPYSVCIARGYNHFSDSL